MDRQQGEPEVLDDALASAWPLTVKCRGCKSKLCVALSDLRHGSWKVSGHHFDGSAVCEDKYTFSCPVCGLEANGNEVAEDRVPLETRKALQK